MDVIFGTLELKARIKKSGKQLPLSKRMAQKGNGLSPTIGIVF